MLQVLILVHNMTVFSPQYELEINATREQLSSVPLLA